MAVDGGHGREPKGFAIAFFPRTNSTNPSAEQLQWTNCFGPISHTRLPAWARLASTARSSNTINGTIMKRVGKQQRRRPRSLADLSRKAQPQSQTATHEPTRVVRRRLESYKSTDKAVQQGGRPLTKLEIASIKMQAKSDVALCMKQYPTRLSPESLQRSRKGHFVQIVPAKRRADDTIYGGNKLQTYLDCKPHFNNIGFAPLRLFSTPKKIPSTASKSPGKPTSPILSHKPLLSPTGVIAASASSAPLAITTPASSADAKSPTKKEAKAVSPMVKRARRISETVVELLPAATPNKVEPSPTKSASPPAAASQSQSKLSPFNAARKSGDATLSPFVLPSPSATSMRTPSTAAAPSKYAPAPTPSKSTTTIPSTPQLFTPVSSRANDMECPFGLAALFASPVAQLSLRNSSTPQKTPSFDFGETSPSFNSISWLNTASSVTEPKTRLAKIRSRRQSEPLIRNCLRTTTQRRSMSPKKLAFNGEQPVEQKPVVDLLPSTRASDVIAQTDDAIEKLSETVVQPVAQSPVKKNSPVKKSTPKTGNKLTTKEVVNIDMHDNPDIFGAKPIPKLAATVHEELPSIVEADEDNDDESLVSVTKDCGRLEAHFKVPSSIVSEVPESQGTEERLNEKPAEEPYDEPKEAETTPAVTVHQEINPSHDLDNMVDHLLLSPDTPQPERLDADCDSLGTMLEKAAEHWDADVDDTENTPHKQLWSDIEQYPASPIRLKLVAEKVDTAIEQKTKSERIETQAAAEADYDYDSPGRDYMREFIKRSKPKPKRPSTTETGSPVPVVTKRQPLGVKSPNTSPDKTKNKRRLEKENSHSPVKSFEPEAKMARRDKPKQRKVMIESEKPSMENQLGAAAAIDTIDAIEAAEEREDDAEMDNGSSRRSSRLRSQDRPAGVKSSIPTPIKIGRAGGRGSLNNVRNEQQDLTNRTRMNTRKNKGSAEYPADMLERLAKQIAEEGDLVGPEEPVQKDGVRSVAWKTPLVHIHEGKEETKTATMKAKGLPRPKTYGSSGIVKPTTRAKTTEQKERTARLAEHFGMVGNGTPAKPQRVTRSKARV